MSAALIQRIEGLEPSISYTTRAPRQGEQNGLHYHFVDDNTFDRMIQEEAFLEWAQVYNHRYGTPQEVLQDNDLLMEGGRHSVQIRANHER